MKIFCITIGYGVLFLLAVAVSVISHSNFINSSAIRSNAKKYPANSVIFIFIFVDISLTTPHRGH